MSEAVTLKTADNKQDYARCVQIRTQVFVIGQNVPPEREIDDHEDDCMHILALFDNEAVGAGRWRIAKTDTAKIERMAVLEKARGKKIGAKMLDFMIEDIRKSGKATHIILGAQDHAIPFYERKGFKIHGEGYMDGGTIPHHDMLLEIA